MHIRVTKLKHYERSVKTYSNILLEFSGDVLMNRLDLRTLDKFVTSTYQRTQRGASLYCCTLKAAFSKAALWDYLSENLFKKIKTPQVSKSFPVFISEFELTSILENTEEVYLRNLFTTAFYTGMLLGELVNIKLSWVDLSDKQITVQCSGTFTSKNKKERFIPFNQIIKTLIVGQKPKIFNITSGDFVFTDSRGRS